MFQQPTVTPALHLLGYGKNKIMINPQLAIALSGIKKWQLTYYAGAMTTLDIRADAPEVKHFTKHGGKPRPAKSTLTETVIDKKSGEYVTKPVEMVTVDWVQIQYPTGNVDGALARHIDDIDPAALELKAAELFASAKLERDTVLNEIIARMPNAGTPLKDLTTDQRNALSDMTALLAAKYGDKHSDSYQANFWGFTPAKVWVNWSYVQSNGTVASPPNISDIPPTPPFKILLGDDGFLYVERPTSGMSKK